MSLTKEQALAAVRDVESKINTLLAQIVESKDPAKLKAELRELRTDLDFAQEALSAVQRCEFAAEAAEAEAREEEARRSAERAEKARAKRRHRHIVAIDKAVTSLQKELGALLSLEHEYFGGHVAQERLLGALGSSLAHAIPSIRLPRGSHKRFITAMGESDATDGV